MKKILLSFDNVPVAEANRLASDLQDYLVSKVDTQIEITKDKNNTMDFGATLAILLGTGSAVSIAKGIAYWIKKRSEVSITIKTDKGEVIATNLTSKDIPTVLENSLKTLGG